MLWRVPLFVVLILLAIWLMASAVSAEPRHRGSGWSGGGHGWGGGWGRQHYRTDPGTAFWGGVVGGVIGGLFSGGRDDDEVDEPVRDVEWCIRRYRSYDTYTRTYLGYDGLRHGCP